MTTPAPTAVIALDLDGVFSPLHTTQTDPDWGECVLMPESWLGVLAIAPEMARSLAAAPAQLVWLTDWQNEANRVFSTYFGRELPVLSRFDVDEDPWWKHNALFDFLDTHPTVQRVVWIDDHLSKRVGRRSHRTMARDDFQRRGIEARMIIPDPRIGLTRKAWSGIDLWLSSGPA